MGTGGCGSEGEREGRETPKREGVREEDVEREKWDVRIGGEEKNGLGRGGREDETWWKESREERANWRRELCGGDQ